MLDYVFIAANNQSLMHLLCDDLPVIADGEDHEKFCETADKINAMITNDVGWGYEALRDLKNDIVDESLCPQARVDATHLHVLERGVALMSHVHRKFYWKRFEKIVNA